MWDTILVEGVDLSDLATIEDMSGIARNPPLDSEPLTIPGRQGAIFVAAERAGYAFDVPLMIRGANRGEVNSALQALFALLDTRAAAITVQRCMTLDTEEVIEQAECVVTTALAPQYLGKCAASLVVTFFNLDGGWAASA